MEKVRIQDDLYHYVNGEWIENAIIPDDKPMTGGFADLDKGVEALMIGDLNAMIKENKYPNVYLERACTLLKAAKNTRKRTIQGIKPALKRAKKFTKYNDLNALNRHLKDFVINDYTLPFNISVMPNMKDANHNAVYIGGPRVILPDTTYYKEERAQQKQAMLGMWSQMTSAVLAQTDLTKEEQALYLEDTLKFDELIAKYVKSQEEWSEYVEVYNPMKVNKVASMLKPLKFKKLLKDLFNEVPEIVVVEEPRYFKAFNEVFNEANFSMYMHWAYVKEILGSTKYLSEELRVLGGAYQRALSGIAAPESLEKYAYKLASSVYSEPLGLYYGEKYFGEEAKKDVVDMVLEIIETYKKRVNESTILSSSTKEKAIVKLSTMGVNMGYPDKVHPSYDEIVFNPNNSLHDIFMELSKIRKLYELRQLNELVDKAKWPMPGHMVNACYNPFANNITFPAAILQAPFYSIKQTRSQNLGGIGAVIGHEISHAFDNNGAKFDECGNINNWWTKEDERNFKKRTKAMIDQFDGIELPQGKVNGTFIVSENIADNGGVAVTLDIMSRMKEANYEEYFINWAKVWCAKAKPEFEKLLLAVDVHGPKVLRANMPPRNFQEWYDTFNVKKTDKMYIAPNKRVVIW